MTVGNGKTFDQFCFTRRGHKTGARGTRMALGCDPNAATDRDAIAGRKPAMTSDKTMVEEIARALHAHEWAGQPKPDNFETDRAYWIAAAQAAATIAQRRVEELTEALEAADGHIRLMQRDVLAYLPPDSSMTEADLANALIGHLDGPEYRLMRDLVRAALNENGPAQSASKGGG